MPRVADRPRNELAFFKILEPREVLTLLDFRPRFLGRIVQVFSHLVQRRLLAP